MKWSWLSFVVGVLVGWLLEWLIDYLFLRRKRRDQSLEISDLQQQLTGAQDRQRALAKQASECAQALESCRIDLKAAQGAAQETEEEAEAEGDVELDATRAGGVVVIPLASEDEPAVEVAEKQDLTKIEGIGPKISGLFQDAGISNFALLAKAPVERLREILAAAGPRFRLANPSTWPQQARLAADGKWDELQTYQDDLKGGIVEKED